MSKELENLLFVLAFALLGWGIQAFKEWFSKKETPDHRAAPPPGNRLGESDKEEKMRRFMEALGLPPDELPPEPGPFPPEARREVPNHRAATPTGGTSEEVPPLMVPRAPRQHPMGPGPNPWASTSQPSPGGGGGETTPYEERMAARRRELEKLKEARAQRKQQSAPRSSPAPTAPVSVPDATPAAPSTTAAKQEAVPEPLFSPLLPETSPFASEPLTTSATMAAGAEVLRESFDVERVGERAFITLEPPRASTTSAKSSSTTPEAAGPLMARLRDPAELRRAFVLKEILGRPKALEGF